MSILATPHRRGRTAVTGAIRARRSPQYRSFTRFIVYIWSEKIGFRYFTTPLSKSGCEKIWNVMRQASGRR